MNALKRILGIVWMALAPAVTGLMIWQASDKIAHAVKDRSNVVLQWSIILIIFIPICAGLFIFGYYSFKGYYDHLPESSDEITDY